MMTCLTVIKLLARYGAPPDGKKTFIKVSKLASKITGTTADLKEGDILSVEQLLYGMMLPSGNDAAYTLAEHFGNDLKKRKYQNVTETQLKLAPFSAFNGSEVKYFLKEMNFQAQKIKMTSTFYDSPHGLMNKNNVSTAADVALLVAECMKIDIYRRIVGTKVFETTALQGSPKDPETGKVTKYTW